MRPPRGQPRATTQHGVSERGRPRIFRARPTPHSGKVINGGQATCPAEPHLRSRKLGFSAIRFRFRRATSTGKVDQFAEIPVLVPDSD
jgi:hypothetical protein